MKESLFNYVDPGIIHFMIYPETINGEGPVLETLKKIARDDFFQSVEITWIKDEKTRQKASNLLKSSHLKVYYGAQPRLLTQDLDLNSFDEKERKKAIDTIKDGIDEAQEMNAEAVAFLSGKNVPEEGQKEALGLLINSINQLCEYAVETGYDKKLVLEIFDNTIDKKALVGPVETALQVAESVREKHDNFGLMVDLSHLPLLSESPQQSIVPIKDHLCHVHIGNCMLNKNHSAYGDTHPRFGYDVGENDVAELAEFLQVLFEIGYLNEKETKTVSFEVKPLENEDSEIVMANAKRVLKKAWALV